MTLALAAVSASAQNVRIGVLGLFHPQQLALSTTEGVTLTLHADERAFVLDSSLGTGVARIRRSGDAVVVDVASEVITATSLQIAGRGGTPGSFVLAVPGKISRRYFGTLEVKVASGNLLAIVATDLETAVASVAAAETTPDTPLEAMKAQAVAIRSYFVAGTGRHVNFDFCDTTHCQFLRAPPAPRQRATKAAAETRGLVLAYESHPFAAMYTRSCSGRTRTPAQVRLPAVSYPYYSVDCKFCRENPARWQNRISAEEDVSLRAHDEPARLALTRRLGWAVAPSSDFTMMRDSHGVILRGTGQGHGIGLCQAGASAMARAGASFRAILSHYYPNTTILSLPPDPNPRTDHAATTTATYPGYQTFRGSDPSR